MSENTKTITFIDHIGRTVLAEFIGDNGDGTFTVKNPAIIHVQPTQSGQLNVQTIPLYFREFVGDKSKAEGTSWKYNYASVVVGIDIDNDPRLVEQYNRLFSEQPSIVTPSNEPSVVKLFDE
jgi:hypothetical protein